MLCLSRDLRGFCAFLCVFRSDGVVPEPAARLCRDLVRRQLFAEAGRQEPLGAGRLLFRACCRARSTGVRPPPLASFGDVAFRIDSAPKTQAGPAGLQDAPSCDFEQRAPPLVQEGSK